VIESNTVDSTVVSMKTPNILQILYVT